MSDIHERDHVKYAPVHKIADPKTTKAKTTGEVTEVHEKPKPEDPEHKTYTILNDTTGKETTYGKRSIIEKVDNE